MAKAPLSLENKARCHLERLHQIVLSARNDVQADAHDALGFKSAREGFAAYLGEAASLGESALSLFEEVSPSQYAFRPDDQRESSFRAALKRAETSYRIVAMGEHDTQRDFFAALGRYWLSKYAEWGRIVAASPFEAELKELRPDTSACSRVFRENKASVFRYESFEPRKKRSTPLLIVNSLINRPFLDLQCDKSFVQKLGSQGIDVYMVDWGQPQANDPGMTIEDHLALLKRAVSRVREAHGVGKIDLMGICQGGILSMCYSALHPDEIENLITAITPINYHAEGHSLGYIIRAMDPDQLVDSHQSANLPFHWINYGFMSLNGFHSLCQKYVRFCQLASQGGDLSFMLRMEKWVFDDVDYPAATFKQMLKKFYVGNELFNGTLMLGGKAIGLEQLKMPILHLYGTTDFIVPSGVSTGLREKVGSRECTEIGIPAGHIGLFVGEHSKITATSISEWLLKRDNPGRSISE